MPVYISLTDSVETATIDGTDYALSDSSEGGWAPAISMDDAPVTETMVINVLSGGTNTVTAMRANLEKLQRILRNIRRYGRGGYRANPCKITVALDSTVNPKPFALLVGAEPLLLPASTNDVLIDGETAAIDGVTLVVTRRGTWLGATENSGTSAAAANPVIQTATFGTSQPTPSPLRVTIGGFDGTDAPTIAPGLILVANAASKIAIGPGDSGPAQYTMVADSAAKAAVGGSVMRYTPTTTDELFTDTLPSTAVPAANSLRTAVWASVRNNGSQTYRVRAAITDTEGVQRVTEGVLVDATTTNPRWIYLGSVTADADAVDFKIGIKASATGGTLDINAIAMLDLTDEATAQAIVYNQTVTHGNAGAVAIVAGTRADSKLTPAIQLSGSPNTFSLSRLGNANLLSTGTTVAALWLATYGAYWIHVDDAVGGDPATEVTLAASRLLATQTPG